MQLPGIFKRFRIKIYTFGKLDSLRQVRRLGVVGVCNESLNMLLTYTFCTPKVPEIAQNWNYTINYGTRFLTKTCVLLGGNELHAPSLNRILTYGQIC